ncbi:hypothetical protein DPQ33_12105 [Oceanidesulfovibrio indonesiensis]|uniref:DNA internalization-related competence protein ComEC/Rec2 n=1 Tax=Oceanidesulfovibrio indonesiensis TaxID=54767 RepID=A0A7M3MCW6_9BACT|nr:ComEC/Rec2 family competence protein [Oceanidesulfovibrio indonesiensis]TVM16362.1 hypothetical protein DPQ33_12105 [Oceanidesulfovibrio indonesiensis]
MDRPALVPLLGWQQLLLAALAGFLAPSSLWAGVLGLVVLLWFIAGSRGMGRGRRLAMTVGAVCVFGFGWLWAGHVQNMRTADVSAPPAWLEAGEKVRVRGRIAEAVTRPGLRLRLVLQDVERIHEDGRIEPVSGGLRWTWINPDVIPAQGAGIEATLKLRPLSGFANDPDGDGYEAYWRNRGVAYTSFAVGERAEARLLSRGEALWETRLAVREKVFRHLIARGVRDDERTAGAGYPARQSVVSQGGAMTAALLLGERYFLDASTMELMGRADLRHTVALSGLHVACMALIGVVLAWLVGFVHPSVYLKVPRPRLAALLACVLAIVYVWLGGGSPSLVRASVMFLFFGVLLWMGRRSVIMDGLFLALAVICIASPLSVTDLRLVLSAASVAGIACIVPFLPGQAGRGNTAPSVSSATPSLGSTAFPWARRLGRYLLGFMIVTLAVHVATMPIRIWFFGDVPVNPLGNAVWLPLLGTVVMPLLVVGLGLTLLPWSWTLAQTAAERVLDLGASILDAMIGGLAWLDRLGAFPEMAVLRPTWPSWAGWWMVLVVALLWLDRRRSGRDRLPRGWQALACAGLLLLVGPPALAGVEAARYKAVSLTVLDVGQGQSLLIEGPGGVRALFDGGGFRSEFFDAGEHVVSPHLTRNRLPHLRFAMVSHGHTDHLKGLLHPLSAFRVGGFVRSDGPVSSRQEREQLAAILEKRKLPVRIAYAGDVIELSEGVTFDVVHPGREFDSGSSLNDSSLALRLMWHGRPLALMAGDVETKAIRAMVDSGRDLAADILVAPHHGGKSSVDVDFYGAVKPRLAVASVGRLNQWNLPSEEFVSAMRQLDVPLYTTAEHGAVTITWSTPDSDPIIQTIRSEASIE